MRHSEPRNQDPDPIFFYAGSASPLNVNADVLPGQIICEDNSPLRVEA
jgi:hypothetical protein